LAQTLLCSAVFHYRQRQGGAGLLLGPRLPQVKTLAEPGGVINPDAGAAISAPENPASGGWLVESPGALKATLPLTDAADEEIQRMTNPFRLEIVISFVIF